MAHEAILPVCEKILAINDKEHEVLNKRIDENKEDAIRNDEKLKNEIEKKFDKMEANLGRLVETLQSLQEKLGGFVTRLLIAAVLVTGGAVVTLCIWIFQYITDKFSKTP